ncbi:MAG: heavy metal-binding domain-containing protein [Candidatus Ranarchaeia archaeon]
MGKESQEQSIPLLLMTTNMDIPGYRIRKIIGLVYGVTVRTRGIGGKIMASLRGLVGGEMGSFVELANETRNQALMRLNEAAYRRGANAIIGVRFDSNDMSTGDQFSGTEVCAYGTAVVVEAVQSISA